MAGTDEIESELRKVLNAALKSALEQALAAGYPVNVTGSITLCAEFQGTVGVDGKRFATKIDVGQQIEVQKQGAKPTDRG